MFTHRSTFAAFVLSMAIFAASSPAAPPPDPTPPVKPPAAGDKVPSGIPVPGKPGYVYSPYDKEIGMIDVRGFPSGTKIKCPSTNKIFLVP